MKIFKLSLILVAAAAVVFGLSGTSFAFHAGGVAECMGCHMMHDAAGANLLVGSDASSACLTCHEHAGDTGPSSYHVSTADADMPSGTAPLQLGPGGDFGWLKKTYIFVVRNNVNSDYGYTHGHNIDATDNGYDTADEVVNTVAPGGAFPTAQLTCVACHDMHGKGRWLTTGSYAKTGEPIYTSGSYGAVPSTGSLGNLATGVYRLLRAGDTIDGVTFPATPPVSVAPSTYNRSEFFTQTRVAYGSGMGDYCGTCHPDMHSSSGILRHPTEQVMSGAIQGNYNSYVKSGIMTGAASASYLSLVPFEEGFTYSTANISTMKSHTATNYLHGPGSDTVPATATVMCLSCHRAHATEWIEMTRWNNETTFIVNAGVYPAEQGRTSAETAAGYYYKNVSTFSPYQRNLCNKCHAKD
jgi:predicted CXXCH cytochrome family protein